MELKAAINHHFCCDKEFKMIHYFGHSFKVPKDTIAIATDENGYINFYQKSIPELDCNFWYSEDEDDPAGLLLGGAHEAIHVDNWKDSLMVL